MPFENLTFFDLNLIIRNFHIVVKALYKVFSAVFTIIFGLFYKKICEFFAYFLSVDFFCYFRTDKIYSAKFFATFIPITFSNVKKYALELTSQTVTPPSLYKKSMPQ